MNKARYFAEVHVNLLTLCAGREGRKLKLPQSRHLCSLCATIDGDKIERTAFLKCQPVGVLLKYLPSLSLSVYLDR